VLLHGDAAISGQGVVAETFNLSSLEGYTTGGTIHIVINNQIGFTTSSRNARSTFFPTDIAKMLPVPIFHVNGDDPDAIVHIIKLAHRFRREFREDCIIDIFCYRRYGHNEGDEPAFTHPRMYQLIGNHASIATLYGGHCDRLGVMGALDQEEWRKGYRRVLKLSLDNARAASGDGIPVQLIKETIPATTEMEVIRTGVAEETLREIAASLTTVPDGFNINPKLLHIVNGKAL
jgi:2-oxoglutarate dehydrogenase complex dehydrogenase (E1) component-like enzyme